MLKQEFESRTGFFPSAKLYQVIEKYYMDSDLDKDAFCKAYKENRDGLAERIQQEVDMQDLKKWQDEKHQKTVAALEEQVAVLKQRLEREEEWKPYTDSHNVPKDQYERLAAQRDTIPWADCRNYLSDRFGFKLERIRILDTVPVYEINRHRQLRKVGERACPPLYNASDWNYVRFDCGGMSYELCDGELRFFFD